MSPHRRRNYLIKRKFQLRYSLFLVITVLAVSLASTLFLSYGLWNVAIQEFSENRIRLRLDTASRLSDYERARYGRETKDGIRLADFKEVELLSAREKEIIQSSLQKYNKQLAIRILILIILLSIATVLFTHRIAGPLFRFHRTFQHIRDGNLKLRIHLRKSDHSRDLLPDLNEMISSLDYSFSKMKLLHHKLVDELKHKNIHSKEINEYCDEIEKELSRYQTSDAFKI